MRYLLIKFLTLLLKNSSKNIFKIKYFKDFNSCVLRFLLSFENLFLLSLFYINCSSIDKPIKFTSLPSHVCFRDVQSYSDGK